MELWSVIVLAATLSTDVLGIGLSCAVRGVKVTWVSKIVICLMSAVVTFCGVAGGAVILSFLPSELASATSGALLCLLGGYIIFGAFFSPSKKKKKKKPAEKIFAFKSLGITVRIIRNPQECDVDRSAVLDFKEALYTGIAVSADSFAAGISLGMSGWGSIAPIMCGVFQLFFLCLGLCAGKKIRKITNLNEKTVTVLSGVLLIIVGIVEICL